MKEICVYKRKNKKSRILVSSLLLVIFLLSACQNQEPDDITEYKNNDEIEAQIDTDQIKTNADQYAQENGTVKEIPETYYSDAAQQGQVVRVDYDTYRYSGGKESISKHAYVYLPFGYDENDKETKYNIVYLMHGFGGTAEQYLDGEGQSSRLKHILDHMIENEEIEPLIVVTPTFYPDNRVLSFAESVKETEVFHYEFENDLIPAVESRFHTYAETTDAKGLADSREHRGFGGFSLGAVTTWYSFVYDFDYIANYLPMSGDSWIIAQYGGRDRPEETAEYLESIVNASEYDNFFIYAVTGSNDSVFEQVNNQIVAMKKRSNTFHNGNIMYSILEGGTHNFPEERQYIYNGLQELFGENNH